MKNNRNLNQFFITHPVFTKAEFEAFLSSRGTANKLTQHTLLAYHSKARHIAMVRSGLYASKPIDNFSPDPYLIASRARTDSTIAFDTALAFYGKSYSVKQTYFFLTTKPISFNYQDILYQGVHYQKILVRESKSNFGIQTYDRSGLDIKVTSLERTLVDILDRPHFIGSWEEIWRSLEMVDYYNIDQVIEYTLLLNNATTTAKVGFFLQQRKSKLMISDSELKPLKTKIPISPHYMDRNLESRLIKDWNLIVPNILIEQDWEETYADF